MKNVFEEEKKRTASKCLKQEDNDNGNTHLC